MLLMLVQQYVGLSLLRHQVAWAWTGHSPSQSGGVEERVDE